MPPLIDAHTHKENATSLQILDITFHREHSLRSGSLYSFGIHPFIWTQNPDSDIRYLHTLVKNNQLIAIGECGFDRRSSVPMNIQSDYFEQQIALSETYHIPLIIHCVHAFSELLHVRHRLGAEQPWMIHGYNNNAHILNELLTENFYFSIGKAVLNEKSNSYNLLPLIPDNRLLLETDEHPEQLTAIYEKTAQRLGISNSQLLTQITDNFKTLFYEQRTVVK